MLMELLKACGSLTELDLGYCGVDHALAKRLLPAIAKHKPQLRRLHFGWLAAVIAE